MPELLGLFDLLLPEEYLEECGLEEEGWFISAGDLLSETPRVAIRTTAVARTVTVMSLRAAAVVHAQLVDASSVIVLETCIWTFRKRALMGVEM